jgi:hypothetical protein
LLHPHLSSYKFASDWGISAYTLIVTRGADDDSIIDDYSSSVSVFDPLGNALSTQSFSCSGTIPGDGVNCNARAGCYMAAPNWAEGTFDTADPYCPNIPKGSPAGTKLQRGAVVELVVSDTTDGPFRLRLAGNAAAPEAAVRIEAKGEHVGGGQGRAPRLRLAPSESPGRRPGHRTLRSPGQPPVSAVFANEWPDLACTSGA